MSRHHLAAAAVSSLLVAGTGLGLASSASAGQPAEAATPAAAARSVIAVRGPDNQLYAKYSDGGFRNLGGTLTAAPAVGYSDVTHQTYYVAIGTTHALYVRTDSTPWTRLVTSPVSCAYTPTVSVLGNQLAAACASGLDSPVYVGMTALTSTSANPTLPYLVNQGGKSIGGPTVRVNTAMAPAAVSIFAYGHPNTNRYDIYERFYGLGAFRADLFRCSAPVAEGPAETDFDGCQNGDPLANGGTVNSLYYTGDDKTYDVDGAMSGTVGISYGYAFSASTFYVTGTNGVVYAKVVPYTGAAGPFVRVGGYAQPGVAATAVG